MKKSDSEQRPTVYEWMIDLCNRTRRDMWVCVPHFADEEYMYQLASLIREQLDPALKCYVEWSNVISLIGLSATSVIVWSGWSGDGLDIT